MVTWCAFACLLLYRHTSTKERYCDVMEGNGEEEEEDESPERLKEKIHQLQSYVRELTEYYSELMEAFEKLKGRQNEMDVRREGRSVWCLV